MKNKPHVNIPKIDNLKPLVKRILIEILEDDKGESKVNFTSNNLSPFEILGLLDYYKNMHETNMFIENRKKTDGEKLSQNIKIDEIKVLQIHDEASIYRSFYDTANKEI